MTTIRHVIFLIANWSQLPGATDVFPPRRTHPCLTLMVDKYHRHCKLVRRACRLTQPGTDELRTSVAPSKRRSLLRVWHFPANTRIQEELGPGVRRDD